MGFLEPPATIVEIHGLPGDRDEYVILEDDGGHIITKMGPDGIRRPRKVRRSEIRALAARDVEDASSPSSPSDSFRVGPPVVGSSFRTESASASARSSFRKDSSSAPLGESKESPVAAPLRKTSSLRDSSSGSVPRRSSSDSLPRESSSGSERRVSLSSSLKKQPAALALGRFLKMDSSPALGSFRFEHQQPLLKRMRVR
jgi:hypothetical protein